MTNHIEWNERYRDGDLPWDTGRPSSELQRVLSEHAIAPCRALDIGCGTGTNSVWLAQQGFDVTASTLRRSRSNKQPNEPAPPACTQHSWRRTCSSCPT